MTESRSTAVKVAPRGVFAFSLLSGAVCGVCAVRYGIVEASLFFLVLSLIVSCCYAKRFGLLALGAFALGAASAKIQLYCERPLFPTYENVVVRLADTNLTQAPGVDAPTFIRGELLRNGETLPVAIRLPRGSRAPRYGAVLQGFAGIAPPPVKGSFGAYCAARRYRGIIDFRTWRETGFAPGIWGKILQYRDLLLGRITESIASDEARAISAALLFGVRGGIRGELRQKFVDAGTIHLFSVSGMHVAVVAAILLCFLRFVPLTPRYLAVILLLGVYTLATGANPPAVRAFCLIGAWALCRAFLREIPSVEVLGIVGMAMLLVNPALVGDTGAQYSFFITALLIDLGEFRRREIVSAEKLLMTSEEQKRLTRLTRWRGIFPEILIFCTVAFAGSIGITLFSGNDFRVGSIVANLVFSCGAVPLFAVGLVAAAIPGCTAFFGNLLLAAMHWCEACGEFFPHLDYGTPPAWQLALYMLMLLFVFFAARKEIRMVAFATAAALLGIWMLRAELTPDKIAFFQDDSQSPGCIVIVETLCHRAVCVNLPGFRGQAELEAFLRQSGVTKIEKLFLTENRRRACGCLHSLPKTFRPDRLIAVDGKVSKNFLDFLETVMRRSDLEVSRSGENGKILLAGDGFSLDYFCARDNVRIELVLQDSDAGRRVSCRVGGKLRFEVEKKWAKNPKLWSYDVRH